MMKFRRVWNRIYGLFRFYWRVKWEKLKFYLLDKITRSADNIIALFFYR